MAKLKIYNDIVNEEEKIFLEWFGMESVCYKDVESFISSIPDDDEDIDIRLFCNGGDVQEGFAMYDALRTSGKKITTVVEGKCASMATIIAMAAPKERRFAQPNAQFCVHNPYTSYMPGVSGATADDLETYAKKVQIQADILRDIQQRAVNIYVERTGTDADTIQALMNEDKWINMDKAVELGFVGSLLESNTDKKTNSIMEKTTIETSLLQRMLRKLGLSKVDDFKVVDQVITSADGTELTVEREEGDPQVGDAASPDGSFTMEDGTVITIHNGAITAIDAKEEEPVDEPEEESTEETPAEEPEEEPTEETPAEEPEEEPTEETPAEEPVDEPTEETPVDEPTEEAPAEEPNAEVEALRAEIAALKQRNKKLVQQLAKSSPSFSPKNRKFVEHQPAKKEEQSGMFDSYLQDARAKKRNYAV